MSGEEKADDKDRMGWLLFSQSRPNASLYLHQASTLLHSMDEALRCSLCHDIFQIPVSVQPCNHSFCNDCIHRKLGIDIQGGNMPPEGTILRCPVCQTRLDDTIDLSKCIVHNRNFEETARHYKTLRPLLKQALLISQRPAAPTPVPLRSPAAIAFSAASSPDPRDDDDDNGNKKRKPGRKSGNPFIREQFVVEFSEDKQAWSFLCLHCNTVAMTSKKKIGNASFLTEHITQRCGGAPEEVKNQAIECTRAKEPPNYRLAQYSSEKKARTKHTEPADSDDSDDEGNGGENRRSGAGRKIANPWIREQFTVEWTESKETWSFICLHCHQVATRSRDKIWNASILTNHITDKCEASNDELKMEALSYTRGAKGKRRRIEEAPPPNAVHQLNTSAHGTSARVQGTKASSKSHDNDEDDGSYAPYM
ncbi:hypothetical protein ACA910_007702 [Epithemia clementina (nom. ined.)]